MIKLKTSFFSSLLSRPCSKAEPELYNSINKHLRKQKIERKKSRQKRGIRITTLLSYKDTIWIFLFSVGLDIEPGQLSAQRNGGQPLRSGYRRFLLWSAYGTQSLGRSPRWLSLLFPGTTCRGVQGCPCNLQVLLALN